MSVESSSSKSMFVKIVLCNVGDRLERADREDKIGRNRVITQGQVDGT